MRRGVRTAQTVSEGIDAVAPAGASCGASLACQLCGRGAASAAELRRHEAACPARCPACAAQFADRAALAQHAAAAHGRAQPPPHVCPACFRTHDTPELLSAHLLRHRQAKQFVCGYDACILRFGTRYRLRLFVYLFAAFSTRTIRIGTSVPD